MDESRQILTQIVTLLYLTNVRKLALRFKTLKPYVKLLCTYSATVNCIKALNGAYVRLDLFCIFNVTFKTRNEESSATRNMELGKFQSYKRGLKEH